MAVADSKKRITISIDKELVEALEALAIEEKRTLSNQISYILENYLKSNKGI